MQPTDVTVPDVVGLPFSLACRHGDEAGLIVTGLGPDGRGVDADSDAAVRAQDPIAGELTEAGSRLVLHVGGSAGEPEPLAPLPAEHVGHTDPDVDPDLQPA